MYFQNLKHHRHHHHHQSLVAITAICSITRFSAASKATLSWLKDCAVPLFYNLYPCTSSNVGPCTAFCALVLRCGTGIICGRAQENAINANLCTAEVNIIKFKSIEVHIISFTLQWYMSPSSLPSTSF